MLMYMLSHLVCAWFAFLIPCYSTWKALSHRPISEPEIERWGMYWVCVGGLVAFESVAEWFVSWLPFYWETRTIFLLFLALPQTQGSTFIYKTYVEPFFRQNETEIDAGIAAAQNNIVTFAQVKLTALWESIWRIATRSTGASSASANPQQPSGQGQPYSSAPSPASVFAMGANLFQTYGTGAFSAIQHSMGSQPQAPQPSGAGTGVRPSPRPSPGVQPRPPFYSASSSASGHSSNPNTPPAFPEPYHF